MSSKQHQTGPQTDGDQRLTVWGERRKEPDWDAFIAALIAYALREIDEDDEIDATKEADA